jgi:hypothetical protein
VAGLFRMARGCRPPHVGGVPAARQGAKQTLREAYESTAYSFVAEDGPHVLRIGQPNEGVARLLRRCNALGAAFVTACNPPGLPPGSVHNVMAMRDLSHTLDAAPDLKGCAVYPGEGKAETGSWPSEASLLIVGIALDRARRLGEHYGQNALVWVDDAGLSQLVD